MVYTRVGVGGGLKDGVDGVGVDGGGSARVVEDVGGEESESGGWDDGVGLAC